MAIKGLIRCSIENLSHLFAISGNVLNCISVSNNACQKLLTSKLPKMANEHSSFVSCVQRRILEGSGMGNIRCKVLRRIKRLGPAVLCVLPK